MKSRRRYPERRPLVKGYAEKGMTVKEIAEKTGLRVRQVNYYIRQLMLAKELKPAIARKWTPQVGILYRAQKEGLKLGRVREVLMRLSPETLTWLLRQVPEGASVADVLRGIVVDVYEEEAKE
jgi:transposase-like protein